MWESRKQEFSFCISGVLDIELRIYVNISKIKQIEKKEKLIEKYNFTIKQICYSI